MCTVILKQERFQSLLTSCPHYMSIRVVPLSIIAGRNMDLSMTGAFNELSLAPGITWRAIPSVRFLPSSPARVFP